MLRHEHFGVRAEDVKETSRLWGHRFPRMWRGRYNPGSLSRDSPVDPLEAYGETYSRSVVAAASLFDELDAVFRYIEPAMANFFVYGHRLRELLILACTEVEACLRGIVSANTPISKQKDRYNTTDYVKLCKPMQLDRWSVRLRDYPALPAIAPFASWDAGRPTQSLGWYDAYNAVKHNREDEFNRATIVSVLESMAAVFVMQCAQWGPRIYLPWDGGRSSPFNIVQSPIWEAGDFYVPDPQQAGLWIDDLFFS